MLNLKVKFGVRVVNLCLQVNTQSAELLKIRSPKIGRAKKWDCCDERNCERCIYENPDIEFVCALEL